MGSLLLTAGSPDMRCILPNAKASEGCRRDYNAGEVGSTVSMKLPYVVRPGVYTTVASIFCSARLAIYLRDSVYHCSPPRQVLPFN